MHRSAPLSTELALRAFEADQQFTQALAAVQRGLTADIDPITAARQANAHGFAWLSRPCDDDPSLVEVSLRHEGGAESLAIGTNIRDLLAGLLGLSLPQPVQAPDPVLTEQQQPESTPAAPAAPAADTAASEPTLLTDEQKATAVAMVRQMNAEQRKAFTIAFRDAFRVAREERSIMPLITELKHLEFIDRFSVEANGGIRE